jgi:hypothetical protein
MKTLDDLMRPQQGLRKTGLGGAAGEVAVQLFMYFQIMSVSMYDIHWPDKFRQLMGYLKIFNFSLGQVMIRIIKLNVP